MKKAKFPLWGQILAILLVGALASVAAYLIVKDHTAERFTVTFSYGDGTVIEQKQVKKGKGTFPPTLDYDGVFRGWSAGFNNVEIDVEVHPMFYDIVDDNLFYFDSAYVKDGCNFTLSLYLAGNVNVNSGDVKLSYDPDVITYEKTKANGICSVSEEKAGKMNVHFSSEQTLTEKTLLTELVFYAKQVDAFSTQIIVSADQVMLIVNGEEKPADYATINNKIYFLQEVG